MSIREFLRIRKGKAKWNKVLEKYSVSISYETGTEITPRTVEVADAFGLGIDETKKFVLYDKVELEINKDDIVYITGDSGSGKSVLLRWFQKTLGDKAVNIDNIRFPEDQPLIETIGKTTSEGLELLSRVGLNDAFLFLRKYKELSDGQRYRYRLAKLIECKKQYWLMDEFCSTLDRDTAKIVAFNLQKLARKEDRAVLAATTHTDLLGDLNPSLHIHKRFGKEITVEYHLNEPAKECSLVKEMYVTEGTTEDWRKLACFHYRSHRISAPRSIFCLRREDELCGVIVYAYPPIACFGRKLVFPKMSIGQMNKQLCTISRVVVHPKYRTIGLGSKLIRETLARAGTPCVELIAVMAKYNPFAEKAGMKKIIEQPPTKQALAIAAVLEKLGFNTQLLGSTKYVLNKLQSLKAEDLDRVREAFIKNRQPRFVKYFFAEMPYGKTRLYPGKIIEASLEKLAHLMKVCGLLLQSKVYLFWEKEQNKVQNNLVQAPFKKELVRGMGFEPT
jgi:ABC-type lipoprotein export system ATPase subunit/GNAT superfamily N-acetyltransferase